MSLQSTQAEPSPTWEGTALVDPPVSGDWAGSYNAAAQPATLEIVAATTRRGCVLNALGLVR